MTKYLKNKGYRVISNNMYILAEGDLPICLCAHIDTVFPKSPSIFYYDQEQAVLWSPQGLGADDRAGCYAIIELLEKGYKPSIILTDLEERGGLGSRALIENYQDCPFKDCRALIQLDRQGKQDAVYYDCDNKDFENLINSYGFKTDFGTFSDISIIAPQWKIAAVNLSVGYYNEHQYIETLHMRKLHQTITKLEKMLKDCEKWLSYAYIPFIYPENDFSNFIDCCSICNKRIPKEEKYFYDSLGFPYKELKICQDCYNNFYSKENNIY